MAFVLWSLLLWTMWYIHDSISGWCLWPTTMTFLCAAVAGDSIVYYCQFQSSMKMDRFPYCHRWKVIHCWLLRLMMATQCTPHWHRHHHFTLRLSMWKRERVRQREAEKRHGILEKWWKQLVVSHYMMMERAVCLSFFIETRRERRARWHVFLCVYHNSMWKCLPVNHNHRVILVDTVHSIYQMNWQYYRCHRCPELL